jgi:hypothetical protein
MMGEKCKVNLHGNMVVEAIKNLHCISTWRSFSYEKCDEKFNKM